MYLDDVFQKDITKLDFTIAVFGHSYNWFQGGIGQVTINSSTGLLSIPSLFDYADKTSANITEITNPTNYVDDTDYTGVYFYDFDLSSETFISYVPIGKNSFAGFRVVRYTDLSEGVYADLWKINGANHYKLIDEAMINQNELLLFDGESESVYKRDGKSDFTGGWHGDETLIDVSFFANNVELDH